MKHLVRLACLVLVTLLLPAPASAAAPWASVPEWSGLKADGRARVERLAGELKAYGACSDSVAACFERGSRVGRRLARVIAYLVKQGGADDDVRRIVDERRAAFGAAPQTIDLGSSPSLGPAAAQLTVVEFADYECPYCAAMTPVLKEAVTALGGKARLVFKYFPLKGHKGSLPAARAAFAAAAKGKFWEMSELLFKNIDDHDPGDLEGYAKKLGLDVEAFRAAAASPDALKAVERDKDLGLRLGVRATPSLFVNGRPMEPSVDRFLLTDRLEEELDRAEGRN